MPLLKKKSFPLLEPPKDLFPDQQVWQIRFTKEIITNYSDYLDRVNLFRKRIWTCKTTGKMNLMYEEALVSEKEAKEKALQIPEEFRGFVLQIVQFSFLKTGALVMEIFEKLRETFVQGEEVVGRLENASCPCKIMKVVVQNGSIHYEVGWLSERREVTNTSIVKEDSLVRQKLPFTKVLLKLFIKESTFQSSPWMVHDSLAKEYRISTNPPKEIRNKIDQSQGKKKRKNLEDYYSTTGHQVKKAETDEMHVGAKKQTMPEQIKYPIEDLLVKPSSGDPVLTDRPVPSVNFLIPMENVGKLLRVWDFLSIFGHLFHLSPFSLDDFERAIIYDGDSNLVAEVHASVLGLLIKDHDEFYSLIHEEKRNGKIDMKIWMQYLCDFLELKSVAKFKDHVTKIKSENYSGLSVHVKLEILSEMIHCANSTETIRKKIDKNIEQQQDLLASKREEDLEERRKRREEKKLKKTKSDDKNISSEPSNSMHPHHVKPDFYEAGDVRDLCSVETKHLGNRGGKLEVLTSRRSLMKKHLESKIAAEREKEGLRMQEFQRHLEERKAKFIEYRYRKLREQRLELFERKMEKLQVCSTSLGKDRYHSRYWFFQQDGRIFVESADHNLWGFYSSKEELDRLMASLNPKGERELELLRHLEEQYLKICSAFQKRYKEMARRAGEDTSIMRHSVRVSALPKDEINAPSFLRYVNIRRR